MSERTGKLERLRALVGPALDGLLTEEEAIELADLLRGDPEAKRIYLRHCQMHAMLSEEKTILGLLEGIEEGKEPDNVLSLPVGALGAERSDAPADSARPARAPFRISSLLRDYARSGAFAAGSLAAGLALALWLGRPLSVEPPANPETSDSPVEEPVRMAELSDGSTVQMAPKSAVSLRYTETARAIELRDGEAHFFVAHDATRPFVVVAGDVQVRAVGTAFNVRRAGARVVVTVTKGKVQVYCAADSSASTSPTQVAGKGAAALDAVTVAAGSQVIWDREEPSAGPVIATVNPSQVLAWREGRLEYLREPLRAVVADLNRYSDRPITIGDKEVGDLRVTATVLTKATGAWLRSLSHSLPIQVTVDDQGFLIRADPTAKRLSHGEGN